MAALPNLITVAQFRELSKGEECAYELHQGEVVAVTRPKARHSEQQHRLLMLLESRLKNYGVVRIEYPYRPIPEFDLRAADVAVISRERWTAIDPDDNLHGAPELVIEIKSPSNTLARLRELVALCLANGSRECWILDQDKKTVTVYRPDGSSHTYGIGESVPLAAFGAADLPVAEIFA